MDSCSRYNVSISGTYIVEIRASDSDGISLPVVLEIDGGGSAEGAALSAYLFSLGIVLIVVFVSSVGILRTGDEDDTDLSSDILEATRPDDIELDSMTVAELKKCRSEGLSISGNKDDSSND